MKLLDRLEKSKIFWSLFWISLLFFILRLPSLIEPNWYGDEGIYQVIGIAINNGYMLYSDIWDNKPPLLYLVYALFNGDQFGVRIFSLIIGLISVWLFFYLSQKIFGKIKISVITTVVFTILFATPLIEGNIANAENFMLLPIISAAILIYKAGGKKYLFFAGLLLSIAFLFKIVAIFDLAALLIFIWIINLPKEFSFFNIKEARFSHILHNTYYILLGFLLPIIATTIYFLVNNNLGDFIKATFFGNIGYVGYANKFIIPQGLLILKLMLLAGFTLFITLRREKFSKAAIFILIWLAFSIFNALFSQRPYTHYLLVLLPGFCLLIGLMIGEKNLKIRNFLVILMVIAIIALLTAFKPFKLSDTAKAAFYYQNAFQFVTGRKDVYSYQAFFDRKTPRDYQLASFIEMHTNKNDRIFIWGDNPQIYTLSKTLPINKYTVAYHILQKKENIQQTQYAINTIKPKYVVILSETRSFPFKINGYISRFTMNKAIIYERSF